MSMQTSFTGALTPNMVPVGNFSGPGSNAQIASSFIVMQTSLGVQSRSTPESKAIEKEGARQQLLTEAFAESFVLKNQKSF